MKLDVGCGHVYHGDVNVDLYVAPTEHRSDDQHVVSDWPLETKKIPNFIKASAEYLPFKSETFDLTLSLHTIEHIKNPGLMLREMVRVTKKQLLIRCPHKYAPHRKKPLHISFLNQRWFYKTLATLGFKPWQTQCFISRWWYFPHEYLHIIKLPDEITVAATKERVLNFKQILETAECS